MTLTKERSLNGMGYYESIPIFKELLENGWNYVDDGEHSLHFVSPKGKTFSLNAALYYAVTGKEPKGKNIFHLMKDEGFNMNTFNRLQYLAEHPTYKGRKIFLNDIHE